MMSKTYVHNHPKVGDWVEAHGVPGAISRRGQIVELLGEQDHVRFRVRWDEAHESILYPADGVVIVAGDGRASVVGSEPALRSAPQE